MIIVGCLHQKFCVVKYIQIMHNYLKNINIHHLRKQLIHKVHIIKVKYRKKTYLKKIESNITIKSSQSYVFPMTMLHRILQPTFDDIQTNSNYGSMTLVVTAP